LEVGKGYFSWNAAQAVFHNALCGEPALACANLV
jgi:hypothetical protein